MTNSKYEAGALNVDQMLAPNSATFEIPPFQRRYAWGVEEVGELLGDLYEDGNWMGSRSDTEPYFLGSIVLAKNEKGSYLILDGQQRLTTISLLLAVLQHSLQDNGSEIRKYLECGSFGKRKSPKIRLQPEDVETFEDLLNNPTCWSDPSRRRENISKSVQKIIEIVEEHVTNANKRGLSRQDALSYMAQRVLYSVEFVQIVAPSEGEAFRLFETLNDRGLPLSAADLIKNKLFAQAGNDYIASVKEYWQEIIDAVEPNEILYFLRYFWIAYQGEVGKDKLYDVFQKLISKQNPSDVHKFMQKLKHAAEAYRHIADPIITTSPWGSETGERLQNLGVFRARSCRPALIACVLYAPDSMPALVKACESITVRYSIVSSRNPNALERDYGGFCRKLREEQGNNPNVFKILLEEIRIVPTDSEFKENLINKDIDKITPSWRQFLIGINEKISTGETRIQGSKAVHVEHILPQNPSQEALTESGLTKEEVQVLISRIGNLTLLSGKKNREISNGPFSRKQPVFASSEIKLNQEVAKCKKWSNEEINRRSETLAHLAVDVWSWPIK